MAVAPEVLAALRPDHDRLRDILMAIGAEGCYAFVPTPGRPTAATARFFNPVAGIPEDLRGEAVVAAAGTLQLPAL